MPSLKLIASAALLLYPLASLPQEPKPAAPAGTVTGHVIYAETQRPARFARVTLARKPTAEELKLENAPNPGPKPSAKPDTPTVVLLEARTALDGSFTIPNVPPADYYVFASLQGYFLPLPNTADETPNSPADLDKVMRDIPVAHVTADSPANVELSLHKGAVIDGRAQFDDGSPVVGMYVQALPSEGRSPMYAIRPNYLTQAFGPAAPPLQTDEDGRFHIAGLAPGKYFVTSSLQIEGGVGITTRTGNNSFSGNDRNHVQPLVLYAPNTLHRSEAKILEIKGDETLTVTLEVPLSTLRTVRGRVVPKPEGHLPDRISLLLRDTNDNRFYRQAQASPDGTFRVDYVPAGTYKLQVYGLDSDPPPAQAPDHQIQVTQRAETGVIVAEHDVDTGDIQLTDQHPETRNP